jgi:hypothetical protein
MNNLDLTPEQLGLPECPAGGQGCHAWMFRAVHCLVDNQFTDDEIDSWVTNHLGRSPQQGEIANTIRTVRQEKEDAPVPRVSLYRDFDKERFDAMTAEGPMTPEEFKARGPLPTAVGDFLRGLFGDRKTVILKQKYSQGQFVWSSQRQDHEFTGLFKQNAEGVWFLSNPVTGVKVHVERLGKDSRRSEECLTHYEYALVESDSVEPGLWLRILSKLDLPIVSVVTSGGKSIHALVRIGAATREEWDAKVAELADIVVPVGGDWKALTAVRLTRLPFMRRGTDGPEQELLYFNPSAGAVSAPNGNTDSAPTQDGGSPAAPNGAPATKNNAFDDIWYDGKNVFMLGGDGIWRYEGAAFFTCSLKVRGFSDKTPRGSATSPMDVAKEYVRKHRRVDGAGPRLYHPDEIWWHGNKKFLNTATAKVHPSNPHSGVWGEGFPRYASILDNVFVNDDYRQAFLAWFKKFYESAKAGNLSIGQVMVLVGPVQCFKSFLIERLLMPAMGGYADLSAIASGDGNGFNAELFHSPLAVVDDTKGSSNEAMQNRYTAIIKKLAAHGMHSYHEKFITPTMVEWKGRVVIAANDDPESIKAVPSLDMSNADKLIALTMKAWEDNPPPQTWVGVEEAELANLLGWLEAWSIPERFLDHGSRYGVRSFVAPEISNKVDSSGAYAELLELRDAWWHRRPIEDQKEPWMGTSVELLQAWNETFDNIALTREWSARKLGRRMSQAANRPDTGISIAATRYGKSKTIRWRIDPPKAEEPPPDDVGPF